MPSDFTSPVDAAVARTLAAIPPEDDYGFTYQQNTAGINGSHGAARPAAVPRTVIGPPPAPDVVRDLEARAGVASLEWLQAQRRAAVAKAAPLRAKRDTFDARRKERRGAILALLEAEHGPIAATKAETVASGDARYKAFLDDAEVDFAVLAVLENEITDWTEQIRSRQAELYLAGAEARLAA